MIAFTEDIADRFWSKVAVGDPDACWPWQAGADNDGYGHFAITRDITRKAHRIAWILTHGDIPDGLLVLHRCDNPPCCNPNHLFLGTHKINMEDMTRKNRQARPHGEINSQAKLTRGQVTRIRDLYASGDYRQHQLAQMFGVGQALISYIVNHKKWSQ